MAKCRCCDRRIGSEPRQPCSWKNSLQKSCSQCCPTRIWLLHTEIWCYGWWAKASDVAPYPIRLREVRPTPEQLEELNSFKILSNPDSPISIQGLKEELPQFLALAADINAENFGIESILPFFQSHTEEIPIWGRFASVLAAQQMNSAAVERVFSFLKQAFKETQETSLSDYVEAVVIQRYNNRDEFHV